MKESYHAILLDTEFKESSFIQRWKILGKKKSRTNPWWQIKVQVPENRLKELIYDGQKLLLNDKFYFQVYREDELYIIFPKKIFKLSSDRTSWTKLLRYGHSLGIPEDQLDIRPVKFEEETY